MKLRSIRASFAALVAAAGAAGCVVLPVQVYVADRGDGTPVYEQCSLTPELPAGVKVERPGLQAIVSIARSQGRTMVRVQFDVGDGTTLVLREHTIAIDARDGAGPRVAPIPHVNPAAPARYPETEAIRKLVLPVDTPLRGDRLRVGNASFVRHYWIAAPFDEELGREVWVTLPEMTIDGAATPFAPIHFTRHIAIGRGLFNC